MTPKHALVFLTYNKPTLIDERLDEVGRYLAHRDDFEVHVFDNGSEDHGVRLVLISRSQLMNYPIFIRRSDHNLGFGRGFNRAVNSIIGQDSLITTVHLISSDVAIFGDLIAAHDLPWGAQDIRCQRIIKHAAGWNEFANQIIPYPEGYYLAMDISAWKELGGFDERFYPYDYEDVDLGYRITQAPTLWMVEKPDLPIRHMPASTIGYSDERFEHTVKMRALFAEKWGLTNQPERP